MIPWRRERCEGPQKSGTPDTGQPTLQVPGVADPTWRPLLGAWGRSVQMSRPPSLPNWLNSAPKLWIQPQPPSPDCPGAERKKLAFEKHFTWQPTVWNVYLCCLGECVVH